MGRKIPGKKHRGVKDPEKQQAERFAKIKDKVNIPPSNPDDQQISSSLKRIIDLKNKVKQGFYNKRKKKTKNNMKLNDEGLKQKKFKGRPEKPIPKFEQMPGESDRKFKRRVDMICADYLKESAFENKYHVDITRNIEGEVDGVVKRPKDELELLVKKLKKEKKTKKTKSGKKNSLQNQEENRKLTKSQKWAMKKQDKKQKKIFETSEDHNFLPQKEQLRFGEVAHAPPILVVPKKAAKSQGVARPGEKQLLLKAILPRTSKTSTQTSKLNEKGVSETSKLINKKGKRKDLPNALRRQLDKQQKEIIEAYKALKSKKIKAVVK
ncbi:coiled-coil domain-containing protein 137 [Euwallacea fornicatus]|uniref:coiled-coil domain-containing protein 137 n=1 Tax=Euwallacea fornicatus TaxID=995702 RepID=UPI00338F7039